MAKSLAQTMDDLEFSGFKETKGGILPAAKAALEKYFPAEAEEWERTQELAPVKGGVVFPGVKFVFVGKRGQKRRELEQRGLVAPKPSSPEALELELSAKDPDTMDPLAKLEFVEANKERYAAEHEVSIREAVIKLRLMMELDVPEWSLLSIDREISDPAYEYPKIECEDCGEMVPVPKEDFSEELCDDCRAIRLQEEWLEWVKENMSPKDGDDPFELELELAEPGSLSMVDEAKLDLPASVPNRPRNEEKLVPGRQSKWNNVLGISGGELRSVERPSHRGLPRVWCYRQSGKRRLVSKEGRRNANEKYYVAKLSSAYFAGMFESTYVSEEMNVDVHRPKRKIVNERSTRFYEHLTAQEANA